jgi:hypothetical protein
MHGAIQDQAAAHQIARDENPGLKAENPNFGFA